MFHAGIALVALGLIGSFLRHGPVSEHPAAPLPAVVQSTPLAGKAEPGNRVYLSSTKFRPAKVKSSKVSKVKASKVKRRQKAKTRSNHVQR